MATARFGQLRQLAGGVGAARGGEAGEEERGKPPPRLPRCQGLLDQHVLACFESSTDYIKVRGRWRRNHNSLGARRRASSSTDLFPQRRRSRVDTNLNVLARQHIVDGLRIHQVREPRARRRDGVLRARAGSGVMHVRRVCGTFAPHAARAGRSPRSGRKRPQYSPPATPRLSAGRPCPSTQACARAPGHFHPLRASIARQRSRA